MSTLFSGPPTVNIPPQVPLSNQLLESIVGQATGLPIELAALQQTQPGFTGLDLSNLQQGLFGQTAQPAGPPQSVQVQVPQFNAKGKLTGFTTQTIQLPGTPAQAAQPGTLALGTQAANQLRGADIAAVQQFGPQALQAYLNANPFLKGSTQALFNQTVGSPLIPQMQQIAQQQLQAGGQLTPEQQAFADQSALAKFQQMGMANQPSAIGAQLLNEDQFSQQRLLQAMQMAQQAQALGNQTFGGASQIFQGTLADPYQSVLGRGSGAGALGPVSGGAGGGLSPTSSLANAQALLNPFAGSNFFQNQSQLQVSQAIANANAAAAQQAGQLGLAGAALGSAGNAAGAALSNPNTFGG